MAIVAITLTAISIGGAAALWTGVARSFWGWFLWSAFLTVGAASIFSEGLREGKTQKYGGRVAELAVFGVFILVVSLVTSLMLVPVMNPPIPSYRVEQLGPDGVLHEWEASGGGIEFRDWKTGKSVRVTEGTVRITPLKSSGSGATNNTLKTPSSDNEGRFEPSHHDKRYDWVYQRAASLKSFQQLERRERP